MRALRFFLKSFYFFFNRVARYTQSKESKNLSKKIAIKRAKSNAKALAIPSVSNFDEVNMRKSPAKQFLEIAIKKLFFEKHEQVWKLWKISPWN